RAGAGFWANSWHACRPGAYPPIWTRCSAGFSPQGENSVNINKPDCEVDDFYGVMEHYILQWTAEKSSPTGTLNRLPRMRDCEALRKNSNNTGESRSHIMKTKVFQPTRLVLAISTALTLGALTTQAGAAEFQFKDGDITGRFDAQLTMG